MEAACRKDRKDKRESREGAFPVNETRLFVSRGTSVPRGPPFPSVKSNSTLFGRIYIYLYIYIRDIRYSACGRSVQASPYQNRARYNNLFGRTKSCGRVVFYGVPFGLHTMNTSTVAGTDLVVCDSNVS